MHANVRACQNKTKIVVWYINAFDQDTMSKQFQKLLFNMKMLCPEHISKIFLLHHNRILKRYCCTHHENMSVKWTSPKKPHFYIGKLGFTRVDIFFLLIFALKHRSWILVRTAYPRSMFLSKKKEKYHVYSSEIFHFYSREILRYIARTWLRNEYF